MEHPKRGAFFLVDLHKASQNDLMNVGIIQAIQMACDGIVMELGKLKTGTDQFAQIDLMRPSFQMNQCLPAAQDIKDEQPDDIAWSECDIGDPPEPADQSTGGGQGP
ncbi:hypothetical protein P9711_07370 [Anoxybacillus geothermalis]|nr:hypothetical protein [Anoxybacillus geothermalis]